MVNGSVKDMISIPDEETTNDSPSRMMTTSKENTETFNVEMSSDEKKKVSNNVGSSFARKLCVQVKRRKVKRQYRRNQDAINFLRRFTLAVVIIDLMLAISESSLISTFFLFLTLSTTFDVKPENVIDTYCYNYQGGGNSICEKYMERVTGYTTPASATNHHHKSQSTAPPENHFPTIPSRPPLTPSESRKLFLVYNQSLYDSSARFYLEQKIDKNSRLSNLFSRLVFLLFENNSGMLSKQGSFYNFLKNESSPDGENIVLVANSTEEISLTSQKVFVESIISKHLKQSIEIISPYNTPSLPFQPKGDNYILFRVCPKMLDSLKAGQKQKPRRKDENKPSTSFPTGESSLESNPFRKNLIQPTGFSRHRWRRNVHFADLSEPMIENHTKTETTTSSSPLSSPSSGHYEYDHIETPVTLDTKEATGSNKVNIEKEKGTNDVNPTAALEQKEQQINGLASASSRERSFGGSGYRLIKGQINSRKFARDLKKQGVDDFSAPTKSRRDIFSAASYQNDTTAVPSQIKRYYRRDLQMICTEAEGNLDKFMMISVGSSISPIKPNDGFKKIRQDDRNKMLANSNNDMKYLKDLTLGFDKNPRHILSLMEAALFHSWPNFAESSDRLAVHYKVENDTPVGERDEPFIWSSVRQKIIESLRLSLEMNVLSPETSKKAERRKHAMEQIYHDYSSILLKELEDVKDMPISSTFLSLYWAIKLYVMIWHTTVCSVLFFGSVFEDKTALNIWGIFNILTSFLHFMVDDWINTNFHPEKTSPSIWFAVIYGVYKPLTILLVANLSAEIFKKSGRKQKGLIPRLCEIIRGRKRPPLIADKCLEKIKGLFITPETSYNGDGNGDFEGSMITTATSEDSNVRDRVYTGIKSVRIKAKIKRLDVNNGNLTVITHTTSAPRIVGVKGGETCCMICGSPPGKEMSGNDDERIHEGRLFYPSAPIDNEAGLSAEDLYPEDTDEEEEDEDELEEVVDDESDESDEYDDVDNEECCHQHHNHLCDDGNERQLMECATTTTTATTPSSEEQEITVMTRDKSLPRVILSSEGRRRGGGGGGENNTEPSSLSLISYAGNGIQGNLLHDTNSRAHLDLLGAPAPALDVPHGPIVDGANLHI